MALQVTPDKESNVHGNLLMGEARCARHEEFSFDNLVAVAVFRHRLKVHDGHERLCVYCHMNIQLIGEMPEY